MKIISIGEVLWDVIGQEEHLGGAPFNFAVHARRLGHEVQFVSAVGDDLRGAHILERIAELGLSGRYVRRVARHPTGIVTVSLDAGRQPQFVIHRPAAYDFTELSNRDLEELFSPAPEWIYFGTLFQVSRRGREAVRRLVGRKSGARVFYDVNLRKDCYEISLVEELLSSASVVKLNDAEAVEIDGLLGRTHRGLEEFCRSHSQRFGWESVCVTRGSQGCMLLTGGELIEAGSYTVKVVDAIGAGDAFAAGLLHGLSEGWPARRVADFANRVGALVASRPGGIPPWTIQEAEALRR